MAFRDRIVELVFVVLDTVSFLLVVIVVLTLEVSEVSLALFSVAASFFPVRNANADLNRLDFLSSHALLLFVPPRRCFIFDIARWVSASDVDVDALCSC